MRKLLVVLMVLALAAPAMADSPVTISGMYDVMGVTSNNAADQNAIVPDTSDADDVGYWFQRFRVGAKIQAADGVTGNLRFDFAEGVFGQDQGFSPFRANDTTELQVDRAYVDVNRGMLLVKAGLQFVPAGQTQVFRDNGPALQFILKTPVSVRLAYIKASEGTGLSDDDTLGTEDTDRYLLDIGYKSDAFKVNAFYVMQKDDSALENEPNVMGVNFGTKVGPVALKSELAIFGGDTAANVDYMGTQLSINGNMKLSDKLSLGVDVIYSDGTDDPAEAKITYMGNPFARFDAEKGGLMGWDNIIYGRVPAVNPAAAPGGFMNGDFFDPFQTESGALTLGVGAKFDPMDALTFIGMVHYMSASEDGLSDAADKKFDSGYAVLLAAVYQLAPKTSLIATYHTIDADFTDAAGDIDVDTATWYGLRMRVAY